MTIIEAGGKVVILDVENGDEEYARRLEDILAARLSDSASDSCQQRLHYFAWPRLNLGWAQDEWAAAIYGADLVVFDSSRMALTSVGNERENWAEAMRRADAIVEDLNTKIVEDLRELGVPPEFAPKASLGWMNRGENGESAGRRVELRRVATTEIAAREKAARTEIERMSLETQTKLLAGGLESDEAKRFLEAMPTAESLMPTLEVGEVERQLRALPSGRHR